MSAPSPNSFKNLILGPTSSLCEKFNKLAVGLSQQFYDWISFEYNEDGSSLTEDYVTLLCAAQCNGAPSSGGENSNMPTPTGVTASDGSFSNKVHVSWNEVTPPSGSVSNYLVYRSASTNASASGSTQIATVSGTTFTYDDTTVTPGVNYNYWVRATNGADTSDYGGPDTGYATAYTEGLPNVADLQASQGFSETTSGLIALAFTAPAGASSVDVYRNTVDDSGTATKIHSDIVCQDTTTSTYAPANGTGVNNSGGTSLVVYDQPPDGATKYYYWVKCKKSAPPEITGFSNSAIGWVQIGTGDTSVVSPQRYSANDSFTIPGGVSRMRLVIRAGGGSGAGATNYWAGGGGAGGDTVLADIDVTPGDLWVYEQTPVVNPSASSGNTAPGTPLSGFYSYEGKGGILTRDADGKRVIAVGGGNGLYYTGGGGAGGPAGSGSTVESGITYAEFTVLRGKNGEAASGTRGGRSGWAFGGVATPPAQFLGGSFNGNGSDGSGGGGSSVSSVKTGGGGDNGSVVLCFHV